MTRPKHKLPRPSRSLAARRRPTIADLLAPIRARPNTEGGVAVHPDHWAALLVLGVIDDDGHVNAERVGELERLERLKRERERLA